MKIRINPVIQESIGRFFSEAKGLICRGPVLAAQMALQRPVFRVQAPFTKRYGSWMLRRSH